MHELRKSCDQCNRAKRKCNGERPCSRCTEKGVECTYSKRRPRTCTAYRTRKVRTLVGAEGAARSRGPDDMALKRCRLSASPATGLVGMEENLFLSDFFACLGFLPLTTEREIREAMVKIMLSSTATVAARQDCGEEGYSCAVVTGVDIGRAFAGGELLLPMEPSTCVFWCAVALGALVTGRATESVTKYLTLAEKALAGYTGPNNGEVAKAWAILAYLYGMAGDLPTFLENLGRSDGVLSEIAQRGADEKLPVGFPEIVKHGETIKLFTGTAGPEEMETFLSQEVSFPELCNLATKGEICRYMMQSYRAFEQSIHEDYRKAMFWNTKNEGAQVNDEALNDDTPFVGTSSSSSIYDQPARDPKDSTVCDVPEVRGCPGLLVRMKMQFRERLGFGRLEAVADRPEIRAGIGGMIINGALIFEKATKGDTTGALDKLGRCVEIFERYPGLHRFAMGEHMGHIMIQLAANINDPRSGVYYQRLRCAFNVTRPSGALPFPPLEEWQGISAYCNNIPCRAVPNVFPWRQLEPFNVTRPPGALPFPPLEEWQGIPAYCNDIPCRGIPNVFPGRQLELSFLRNVDTLGPLRRGFVSQCAHQAPDGPIESQEVFEQRATGRNGAMTPPDPAHSTDGDIEEIDLAAEDWLEATRALRLAPAID
eukprot:g14765.t2